MFKHKCEMCGLEFETNNTRAKYCIYCRDKAQAARNRAYAEKKKSGSAVKIGSEQICPICGKTYTVTSGSQKYCKECTAGKKRKKSAPNTEYSKGITIISVSMFRRESVRRSRLMRSLRV